jgi:hypothetical protein
MFLAVSMVQQRAVAGRDEMKNESNGVDPLEAYDVVWESPSVDQAGSMPIGNGDIGMNVWVEPDGDLLLLLSKTDAWSDNGRLLKLGRVRISLSPNPFAVGEPFKQILRLRHGEINISAGEGERAVALNLRVDANQPVIRVQSEFESAHEVRVSLEIWRDRERRIDGEVYGLYKAPYPVIAYPDTVREGPDDRIVWYHRNKHSIWENNLRHQGLEDFIGQSPDPLLHRTFGGIIVGDGLVSENAKILRSAEPTTRLALSIFPHTAQTESADHWLRQSEDLVTALSFNDIVAEKLRHREWWNEFWNRSWIRIAGSPNAESLTRGYTLQRWINACAGRGAYPIKFNGSLFTVGSDEYDPDHRLWGGCYWWQNTRLAYWPMLASGDIDMMMPLFRMYAEMLPLAEHRTRKWFGHGGAFVAETAYFWGMYNDSNYGFERPANLPLGETQNTYIRFYFNASIELMAMMLDVHAHTHDRELFTGMFLPMFDSFLKFWSSHYRTNSKGHLRFYPAQSLETFHDAANPTPEIVGLGWVLGRLLDLPADLTGDGRRKTWEDLLRKLPPIPIGKASENGTGLLRREFLGGNYYKRPPIPDPDLSEKRRILPAERVFGSPENYENPELYAVFPYRHFGVGKPDLELARFTFATRRIKGNRGWFQDDIQAAYLGLTETAAEYVSDRASHKDEESRFPAFWGPNFDWVPDQDHGAVLMMALQAMLLQADDGKILLFPAWPHHWDVDFRLHAPGRTVVEGRLENGEVVDLKVTPPERERDVVRFPLD